MAIKYIFVTGGVVSGLGKGITAASIGRLLKDRGHQVTIQKFDPYINVDPGTMSPYQHGEVFVTDDGAETDLDLGHYERFIDENLSAQSSVTTGQVYWNVINKERKGDYLGGTVQVIPHITNEIKSRIYRVGQSSNSDIVITEIGGTIGDIESLPYVEAIRQVANEVGRQNVIYVHVTLVPTIPGSSELKSKPTQHSVKELRSLGIQPNIIVCRSEAQMPEDMIEKISLFCNVRPQDVIQNLTADTLYSVPILLEKNGLADAVCHHLALEERQPDHGTWLEMLDKVKEAHKEVTIGIVGKYVKLPDAYLSVAESIYHGGISNLAKVHIRYINSERLNRENCGAYLDVCDGVVVPGGFGKRGVEGKIEAVRYCRLRGIPFFGICLGMQMAVVEFARNVLHLTGAHSAELQPDTPYPVIDIMENQKSVTEKGGSMRLGLYPCRLEQGSKVRDLYQEEVIYERHRHRYEFNNAFLQDVKEAGMTLSGVSPNGKLVEIVELKDHPWFVGVQFHPEFKSRPNRPHPLFVDFIRASLDRGERRGKEK